MTLAGSFLVARPVLRDPNFAQTVVLLLAHNENGAFGVVVNRPAPAGEMPIPVFEGGPCPSPGLILLHGHSEWATPAAPTEEESPKMEAAPGIYIGDAESFQYASKVVSGDTLRVRVYRGYAGWGGGQLESELAAGAWATVPASGELLFETPIEELWDCLRPPTLPEPSLN
jgi:putative transcriptional regulator